MWAAAALAFALAACAGPVASSSGSRTTPTIPGDGDVEPALRPADADLRDARMLDTVASRVTDPADARIAWLAAAAAWDRVVEDAALPRLQLRDAAAQAVMAIRLARDLHETPPLTPGPLPPRVARELAAVDRHVAMLDQPDGADGLLEQFDAAQLAATWGATGDADRRLDHILTVRRDLEITPIAADLLFATLKDPPAIRRWVDTLLGDPRFVRRFPDSVLRVRDAGARLDFADAVQLMDRGDHAGCAAAFEHLASIMTNGADVARYDQAVCLERGGKRADAVAIYRALIARFPGSPLAAVARQRLAQLNAP